jgi:membrane-bound inhibitor of C-type lysozyme
MKKYLVFIAIILIVIVGMGLWYTNNKNKNNKNPSTLPSLITKVSYICKENKTIELVEPGEMPKPTGSVKIVLSDGRKFDLAQTISADGSRYANSNESFVF